MEGEGGCVPCTLKDSNEKEDILTKVGHDDAAIRNGVLL